MTAEKVGRWGYGDDRHRLQEIPRCPFVRVVQTSGGGPRLGGTNETGHYDAAMPTKSKCPPRRATGEIRYIGLGQVGPTCKRRSHSEKCVEGSTNGSLFLSCCAKRAPAERSLELAWQPWDEKKSKGPSSDMLKRTAAVCSLEMATPSHLFALARNCPMMTT